MPEENKNPTTLAMSKAIESRQFTGFKRGYLGMSELGSVCETKLWFNFRFASPNKFPFSTLYKFDDGHYSEDLTAKRLRQLPSIKLETVEQDGVTQFGFSDIGGHLKGHIDGYISGTVQRGKEELIWEHKCVDQAGFRKLSRLREKHGEAYALSEWNKTYFVQAQMYMHYSKLKNHFLTVATSGSRDYIEIITAYDEKIYNQYHAIADDIICSDSIPNRINERNVYPCNICNHSDICFNNFAPMPNCRTCIYSEALVGEFDDKAALWWCHKHDVDIPLDEQIEGCSKHLYNPDALKYMAVQIDCDGESVTYELREDFKHFTNGIRADELTSKDIYKLFKEG